MSTPIDILERKQLRDDVPDFKAGDTVRVHFQVIEGQRRRVQVFEGIVIKRQGPGARETFDVNRAKLYYLRSKVGKKARVREKQRS